MSAVVAEPAQVPPNIADWPYQFEIVPLRYLTIDVYQRPLTSFVEKIVKTFNPALVGTLCVSKRSNTKFAVIDGQTRAKGMERLGMKEAPCVVFTGLSREQEAALFALFQTERRGMTSAARFNAQVIAKVASAVAINEIVEGIGFKIDANPAPGDQTPAIRAVAAVEYVYHGAKGGRRAQGDPELLAKTLETIKAAWPKLPDTALTATMIRGLGYFLAQKENERVDLDKLALKLGKVSPSELAKRAEQLREGRGMSGNSPMYLAEAIQAQYRKTR